MARIEPNGRGTRPSARQRCPYPERGLALRPLPTRLQMVQRYGRQIKNGNHPTAHEVARVVAASDFQPEIVAAAKEALSPITQTVHNPGWLRTKHLPYSQFGFWHRRYDAYLLGAFHECLPREYSIELFIDPRHKKVSYAHANYKRAMVLLCFSTARTAVEFLQGVERAGPRCAKLMIKGLLNRKTVKQHHLRRYEADDLLISLNANWFLETQNGGGSWQ